MHQQPLLSLRQRLHADTIKPFVPSGGILVELNCVQPSYLINQLKSGMDFCIGVTGQPNRLDGNVQYLQARIKKTIPIESDLANVVVVADLPAFHENPRAILTECFRILKPAGTLIVVMPRSADNWLTRIGAWSGWLPKTTPSYSHYSLQELVAATTAVGFRNVSGRFCHAGLDLFVLATK